MRHHGLVAIGAGPGDAVVADSFADLDVALAEERAAAGPGRRIDDRGGHAAPVRVPNGDRLHLEVAGIAGYDDGHVIVDEHRRCAPLPEAAGLTSQWTPRDTLKSKETL